MEKQIHIIYNDISIINLDYSYKDDEEYYFSSEIYQDLFEENDDKDERYWNHWIKAHGAYVLVNNCKQDVILSAKSIDNNISDMCVFIDSMVKQSCLDLSKTKTYIKNALMDLGEDLEQSVVSDDLMSSIRKSLINMASYLPVFENKKDVGFYIDPYEGSVCVSYKNKIKDILNIIIKDDGNIVFSCARERKDIAMYTGNINIGSSINAQEIEAIFSLVESR